MQIAVAIELNNVTHNMAVVRSKQQVHIYLGRHHIVLLTCKHSSEETTITDKSQIAITTFC